MAESEDNHGVSEQSNGEKDHHRENSEGTIIKEAEPTGKRSYECVYCKRGFTNAQALGGHMNIHRKDRANKSFSSSPSPSKNVPFGNRPSLEALWSKLSSHSSTSCASLLNPNNHLQSYMQVAISSASSSMSGDQDEAMGSNLSLHIGSSNYVEIADEKGDDRMDDIDLELRLGRRDP